jgi:hypothetical protein
MCVLSRIYSADQSHARGRAGGLQNFKAESMSLQQSLKRSKYALILPMAIISAAVTPTSTASQQQKTAPANWTVVAGENIAISFGTDSSLTVTPCWDNVTGWGSPLGLAFIKAAAGTASK